MVTNGCCGKCCEAFTMSETPEQRAKSLAADQSGERWWIDNFGESPVRRAILEDECQSIQFIQDMIIELPVREDGLRTYTCHHYDRESKLCTVYDMRPGLCRRYPNGTDCMYEGCDFKCVT